MIVAKFLILSSFLCTVNIVWSFCINNVSTVLEILQDTTIKDCNLETTTGEYYNCPSLQAALNLTVTDSQICNHFIISLHSGVHHITVPIITNASVSIIGDGTVNVVCTFDAERIYYQTGNLHSLYFNISYSVDVKNINFDHCPFPIRIFEVDNIMIVNSTFRYFTEAVFDIHNSINVTVFNCSFLHNRGTGVIQEPYRGNTGALAITYNLMSSSASNPNITVTSCNFINNSALATVHFRSSNQVFGSGIFTGRGGAMAVFVREHYFNITAHVYGCYFEKNMARSYAGSIYFLFTGHGSHYGVAHSCQFVNNLAQQGGAGVVFVGTKGNQNTLNTFRAINCTFIGNKAFIGAGLYYSINLNGEHTNIAHLNGNTFLYNSLSNGDDGFGAAIAVDVADNYNDKSSFPVNTMTNTFIANNSGSNSIVSIGFLTFKMAGTNSFIGNNGSAFRVVGARVIMSGSIEFINNTSIDGAALYLLSFSQIRLSNKAQLLFHGNSGRYGASVFVSAVSLVQSFQQLPYNPQCFFVLESDSTLPPILWQQTGININFTGNIAWFGAAVYATSLTSCSWVSNRVRQSFDESFFPQWPIFHISNDNKNIAFQDLYNQTYSFVTDSVRLDTDINQVSGWPGQTFNLSLKALDELGNPSGSLTRFSFNPNNNLLNDLDNSHIFPDTVLISQEPFMVNFTYHLVHETDNESPNKTLGNIAIFHYGVLITSKETDATFIPLIYQDCIGGYTLTPVTDTASHRTCECDQSVRNILSCEQNQDTIIIESNLWAAHVVGEPASLYFYWCPPGYCQCFFNTSAGNSACESIYSNTNPDKQCVCSRKGILCGECKEGGVSVLLNNCVSCSNNYLTLILVLVILDTLAIFSIVFFDIGIPEWSYPFLFYIQMVPVVGLYFPPSFVNVGKYLYYLSSALGFYFVYDFCLSESLSTSLSYFLKFIPLLNITVIIPLTILLRYFIRQYQRFSFISSNTRGIWTVILLVYSHIIYSCLNILNCPVVPQEDGRQSHRRWYFSGETECFTSSSHLWLTILSLFVLLLSTLLIPVIILMTYVHKRSKKYYLLKKMGEAFKEPFRKKFGFWCGMELIRRLLLLVIITALPYHPIILVLYLVVLIAIYGYLTPYKQQISNWIELATLSWFVVLLLLQSNPLLQDTLTYTSHSTSSIPQCDNANTVVTIFALLLAVFYYIPVLVALVCMCVWITIVILKMIKRYQVKTLQQLDKNNNIQFENEMYSYYVLFDRRNERITSTEIVDPAEWEEYEN